MRPLLALAILLASCGSTPPDPTQPAVPTPPPIDAATDAPVDASPDATPIDATPAFAGLPPDFAITLERTRCFGTCPSYTLTISATGDVFFSGLYPKPGCAAQTIDVAIVTDLARRIHAMNFFTLKDRYTADVTDHPSARITVTSDGRRKHVDHYKADPLDAPDLADREALSELEAAIDGAARPRLPKLGRCHGKSEYPGVP